MPYVLIALAFMALIGGARRGASSTVRGPVVRRVLLIGDSLADGLKTPLSFLATASRVSLDSQVKDGTTIPYWATMASLQRLVDSTQPTHVLVSLGTNDEKAGILARDMLAIDQLLQVLRSRGAVVAWIGPPKLPFPRSGVSDLARTRSDRYFDSEALAIPRASDGMGGNGLRGLHPTGAGYSFWADEIWKWLLA